MTTPSWSAWWRDVRWPVLLFVPLAISFAFTDADLWIARTLFFDAEHGGWMGAHEWWVDSVLHVGGRWLFRAIVLCAIALWVASFSMPRLRPMRRPTGIFVVASLVSVGIVGLLKIMTNVDCPWDLSPFGGQYPFIPLFGDRPDALRTGHCFPAAHASSGYALIALYFAARERSRRLARAGIAAGIVCGVIFGLAQQSRGAHFMSHDLWSAFLVWVICASVYSFAFDEGTQRSGEHPRLLRDDGVRSPVCAASCQRCAE